MASPKDYFDLVKAIGESKSKQEEDRIITEEVIYLKKAVNQTGVTKKKLKELIVRAIYVEMLGQDASFAYIKAVELCASTSITQKKVGYLSASLCFSPSHEFRFMLVNQIQRDMKSTSILEVSAALVAVCKLVTEDMIPAVIGDVLNQLKHENEAVRKKAVAALHRFYQLDKRSTLDHIDKLRRALCDKDPCVMASTLPLFQAMIADDVMPFKDLVPSFVSILKQVVDHRLPRDFDYHRIPSPWIQMNLLKILAMLGRGDQASSEGMYEVLIEVMKRADTGINVGYAIVYECIKSVTTIYPNTVLMDAAATAISRFIRSESHNLKYIGIKGLAAIVKDFPKYAADHQMAVIDCLEDPDETLKRKTLDLLFRMTNAVNVEFIVDKLLSFLSSSNDDHFRSDLVHQITQCAERFAPSNTWYVQTIIRVFELAGDKVKASVAQTLTQLIAEGAEVDADDEDAADAKDDELRCEAVEHFLDLLDKPKIPPILAQTMAWVLGEYGYLSSSCTKEVIMDKLSTLATQAMESETKAQVMTALSKLIAQSGTCPAKVMQTLTFYSQSQSLDVQERCLEILTLLKHSETMVDVLPVDGSCEDIEVDEMLSFLNGYVQDAINLRGARPYHPPESFRGNTDDDSDKKSALNITPYEMPKMPTAAVGTVGIVSALPTLGMSAAPAGPTPLGPALTNQQPPPLNIATAQGNQLLSNRGGAALVWGKKPEPAPTPPVSAPVVQASPQQPDQHQQQQQQQQFQQPVVQLAGNTGASPWGGSQQSGPVAPAEPEKPKVLSEKEKMAAALFGGVGGGTARGSATAAASKRRSTVGNGNGTADSVASFTSSSSLAATAAYKPTEYMPTAPSPAAAVAPPAAPPAAAIDIFANMSTAMSPPINTAAVTTNGHSSGGMDELLDMVMPAPAVMSGGGHAVFPSDSSMMSLSPMSNNSSSSMPNTTTNARSNNNLSDIFANIDLSGGMMSGGSLAADQSIKPFVINTAEFGRRWGSTPIEVKLNVTAAHFPRLDLESVRRAMPVTYHHVESIPQTQECIYAATATTIGAVILVHVKINAPRRQLDMIIKSTAQDVCLKEQSSISLAISAFRG